MMSSQKWALFRQVRVIIFALCILLSMAWAVIYAIFLIREWKVYDNSQRAIIIALLAIDGLSTILLYLMIIVRFRLWLDGARISFLLFFQAGGTVTFSLFRPSFPCDNIGSESDCQTVASIVIFGGWALSGLLLLYAFCLAIMSYIPPPPPRPNPEAVLVADTKPSLTIKETHSSRTSASSDTWLLKSNSKKRHSTNSMYSQGSWVGSSMLSSSGAPTSTTRSPSISTLRQNPLGEGYDLYRLDTPGSMRSTAASSISSYQSPAPPAYHAKPVQSAQLPMQYTSHIQPGRLILPNPFTDPIARYGSSLSMSSSISSQSEGHGYSYRPPPRILAPSEGVLPMNFEVSNPRSPRPAQQFGNRAAHAAPGVPPPDMYGCFLTAPRTPTSLKPAVLYSHANQRRVPSPGVASMHSLAASMHSPSRQGSLTVPRSPSPISALSLGLPSSPRSLLLPTHPELPLDSRGTYPVNEIRRYGSAPILNTNDTVATLPYRSDYGSEKNATLSPSGVPSRATTRPIQSLDFGEWKQNAIHASEGR